MTKKWDLLTSLIRQAAYTNGRRDWGAAGVTILRRAQKYLLHESLIEPGWSTRHYDPTRK